MSEDELRKHFENFISQNKLTRIDEVLKDRTDHLCLVLENIYQPQNASATLRTSEILGVQNIHVIEAGNAYKPNRDIALGSSKWVNINRYTGTKECLASLKADGYRIIATTPHKESDSPETLDLNSRTALVFGTELEGISDTAINEADGFLRLPMYGFTESYNLSVSVAMTFYTLVSRLHQSDIKWQLDDQRKEQLRLQWYKKIVKNSQIIEKEFLASLN